MNFRFAVISDPHIAVPKTIEDHAHRFHLVEISIPAFEVALQHLSELSLDFLLLPGDLTQDGEPENHQWLQKRLATLPYPAYVVPGNHDVPSLLPTKKYIGLQEFPHYYEQYGYNNQEKLYYIRELLPGVQLIGLNSNQFDSNGKQLGCLDSEQLIWLEKILPQVQDQLVLVMIHHNVIEHLPGQADHVLGQRYMLTNASHLLKLLEKYRVKFIFTGHLHIQDVVKYKNIYEITTGSLVSYPHPYRIIEVTYNQSKQWEINIKSHRVQQVNGWEKLPEISRQFMGDRSYPFMLKLLTTPPLNLSLEEAEPLLPKLRDFWADIAEGDRIFDFASFPPFARRHFYQFGAIDQQGKPHLIDNHTTIIVKDFEPSTSNH
jgi:3',5'-cyclic AMP phosphodiesterase CpdA